MDAHDTFHDLVGELDYPMFIVTVRAGGEQAGCLIGFGTQTSMDPPDKFTQCAWEPGPDGVPILQECGNWFAGRIRDRVDFGDHVGHLPEPIEAHHAGRDSFFEFHRTKHIQPGHPA